MKSSEIYIYNTHTLYINTITIITEYRGGDKIKEILRVRNEVDIETEAILYRITVNIQIRNEHSQRN